jgi:hypothetical protein
MDATSYQSLREQAQRRRLVAIHEAGHAIVAEHLRMHVEGMFLHHSEEATMGGVFAVAKRHAFIKATYAVAGAVATAAWDFRRNYIATGSPDFSAFRVCGVGMSPEDWKAVGLRPQIEEFSPAIYRAIDKAAAIIADDWPEVRRLARKLIESWRLRPGVGKSFYADVKARRAGTP